MNLELAYFLCPILHEIFMFHIYAKTNSPLVEDHHPKNYCNFSKMQSLDTSLTDSLVGLFTFALQTTQYSPEKISTTRANGQLLLGKLSAMTKTR